MLIVLEGLDGSGKSSVARRLAARWRRRGIAVVRRREPANPSLGRAALSLAPHDAWASAMLFSLDRLLARPQIDRALRQGRVVLQDRSFYSTLAYQAHGLGPEEYRRIADLQAEVAVRPDRVIWLDLPAEAALRRVRARGARRDAVETTRFLRRVRTAYAGLQEPDRWIRLDATLPLSDVVGAADRGLEPFLRSRLAPKTGRR
ncbi:MAG: dTMP kinase [Thermoplasmata archaeon]|nr:dTMP kinase [Thermoplasmata archaeon]